MNDFERGFREELTKIAQEYIDLTPEEQRGIRKGKHVGSGLGVLAGGLGSGYLAHKYLDPKYTLPAALAGGIVGGLSGRQAGQQVAERSVLKERDLA